MRIEEVEALDSEWRDIDQYDYPERLQEFCAKVVIALRAEAWHPIERADELGYEEGRDVLLLEDDLWFQGMHLDGKWVSPLLGNDTTFSPTHFRFINPPEGA